MIAAAMESSTISQLNMIEEASNFATTYVVPELNDTSRTFVCDSNSTSWLMTSPVCSVNHLSFVTFILVALVLGIITVGTIFGNLLVLLALYRFKKLRSMSNCLIGNLAASDLLLALSVLPISATYDLLGYWVYGEIMCTIWLCIDVLYCTASIWGLCTIAVDRYTATVYPVWYHERKSPTRALVYIVFVWLFSIIVSVAPFIGWREMIPSFYKLNTDINRQDCILFQTQSYVVYSAMGSFVIPTFLMVFLYVQIFIVLKKRTRSMQPMRKRVLYPSESDFESEAHALEEADSDERTDVELRAASTQTTPVSTKRHSRSNPSENGLKQALSVNGNNMSVRDPNSHRSHLTDGNKNKTDTTKQDCTGLNYTSTSLTIEVTDLTEPSTEPPILAPTEETNGKVRSCNLTVNFEPDRGNKSPSHVSRKSTNDSSEFDFDPKNHNKQRSSKAMFFPWNNNKMGRGTSSQMSVKHKYELREQRATKRMAMIMACFCFCWWPFLFMYTIRSFCESCHIDSHIQAAIIWLGYANSSLNPLLYTIFNDDFRKAFKKIVTCTADRPRRRR